MRKSHIARIGIFAGTLVFAIALVFAPSTTDANNAATVIWGEDYPVACGTGSSAAGFDIPQDDSPRTLPQTAAYFAVMVGILVFANWGKPVTNPSLWASIYAVKWWITLALLIVLAVMLLRWFRRPER